MPGSVTIRVAIAERAALEGVTPRSVAVPGGSKWCPDCGDVQPLSAFGRNASAFGRNAAVKSGINSYCKPCHNARTRRSKESVGGERTYHLRRRYGITGEEADAMLASQSGVCAICRAAPAAHVDHDHATGGVRALLCFDCNGGLAQFKDDPDVLRAAADYVRFHPLRQHLVTAFQAVGLGPVRAIRPGEPPVGSPRHPEPHSMPTRGSGRSSGTRRRKTAGEVDG